MEARVASSQSSTQLELAYHQWTVRLNSLPAQPSGYPPVGHSDRSSDLTDYLNLRVRSRAASGTQPMCAGGTDEPWLEVEPPSLVLDSRALTPTAAPGAGRHYQAAIGPARHAGSNRPFSDQGACAAGSVNSSPDGLQWGLGGRIAERGQPGRTFSPTMIVAIGLAAT